MMRTWICIAVVAMAAPAAGDPGSPVGSSPAGSAGSSAGGSPGFSIGGRPAWFITGGATAGGAVTGGGGFVGGELSLTRLVENRVVGVYADAFYDFGADGAWVTVGPELAMIRRSRAMPFALGVDGGLAVRAADDTALGAAGRLFVSVAGSLALFGRYAYLDGDHVVQIGVTLKFPLAPPFGAAAP